MPVMVKSVTDVELLKKVGVKLGCNQEELMTMILPSSLDVQTR